uniref:CUB domain-containing protein n=1 Tax=Heterorhabditis bacteriophora TaxID=37862 RepID=A0A1I7XJS5_HETBA
MDGNIIHFRECSDPDEKVLAEDCDTVCFEMAIPLDGTYEFLRGCHSNFISGNKENQLTPVAAYNCTYSYRTKAGDGNIQKAIQCARFTKYDGISSTKDSCMGSTCTRVKGKINGRNYEEYSCAPFSPYDIKNKEACVWIESNTTFRGGPGFSNIVATRHKRDISMIYSAEQCFCKSGKET